MNEMPINERAQHLLKVLIEKYIAEGQPVGSRALALDSGLDLSSATIRKVLADLEEVGLIRSPHTSAGRVPTMKGYRVFVDSLVSVSPLKNSLVNELKTQLDRSLDEGFILKSASSLISEITHLAGIVTLPKQEHIRLRQLEFLPLGEGRVLVIIVVNDGEIQNRVIQVKRDFRRDELAAAANYLNSRLAGRNVNEVKDLLVSEMDRTRHEMDQMMVSAIELASQAFAQQETTGGDYVLSGETQLMACEDVSDVEKLRKLFEAFNEKRDILGLFEHVLRADGVQIFIGEESGYTPLGDFSAVTAPYSVDGEILGVLGVIGPTRMNYNKVIPMVDVTAKLLSAALKQD